MKLLSLLIFTVFDVFFLKAELKVDDTKNEDLDLFSKCYEGLGCIETDARWYDKKIRPVNLKPLDRHIIKTDFLLIKLNKEDPDYLQYNSLNAKYKNMKISGFDFKSDLMILIHDFTSNGYTGWIKHVASVVFTRSLDMNIVSVDWQRGAEPSYDQAIANARVVALEIVNFLKELKEKFQYNMDDVHIIGHGVGAHIAGYVGTGYSGIKKITGLDPSGVRFDGMSDVIKLNPNSAKYVEVIHTDAYNHRSQGSRELMGHSDFFVNNADVQLGCSENKTYADVVSITKMELAEGEILPGCSHKRSFKYFIEAIALKECAFLGLRCDNYEQFSEGKCSSCNKEDDCRTFGTTTYRNSLQKISYYLNVAESRPFCMFVYKVIIIVKSNEQEYYGFFDFILIDENAKATEANLATDNNITDIQHISPDKIYIYINLENGQEEKCMCTYIYMVS